MKSQDIPANTYSQGAYERSDEHTDRVCAESHRVQQGRAHEHGRGSKGQSRTANATRDCDEQQFMNGSTPTCTARLEAQQGAKQSGRLYVARRGNSKRRQ